MKPIRAIDNPFPDMLSESVNNTLCFAVAWFSIAAEFFLPLGFSMDYQTSGAFLMAAKRFTEYRMIGNPEQAILNRKPFGRYSELSLLLSSVFMVS